MRALVVLGCIGLALAGALTHFTSAAFTNATAAPANTVAVDKLANYFSVVAGSAVQAGTYPVPLDEAPEVPGAPTATQAPNGRLNLNWGVSSTTTNLAGYNLYRSSGAGFTKLNATPLAVTTYADTATVDGTTYTYKVRAV